MIYHPTLQFGFQLDADAKEILHQLWVSETGLSEWRPVPIVELGPQRTPATAGCVEDDE